MVDITYFECPFCNKKFTKRAFISKHLNIYNLPIIEKEKLVLDICYGREYIDKLINDYVSEKFSIYELPIDMSKYLTLIGVKRTSKEERATNRYKEKYTKSIEEKYGVTNISQLQSIKDKKKATEMSKYESYDDYITSILKRLKTGLDLYYYTDKHNDTITKINNTIKEKYGVEHPLQNKDIKNNVGLTEPGRVGYGFGLGVAVRMERGLSAINGNVGDFTWNGAYGTIFWADPKEQMVVVMMGVAPGDIRKIHREQLNSVIYGALEK